MKKYIKNKGFIPKKIYNKIEEKKIKSENEIFILFFMINLLIIPVTMRSAMKVKEKPAESVVNVSNIKNNQVNLSDVNTWINSTITDDIEEVYIDNNNGQITVNNLEKIDELSSIKQINIRDVNRNENGKYRVGVSLNE